MQRNTASQKWTVFAFDRSTGEPKTGDAANITANLRIDDGTAAAITDTNPTEQEDGYYVFDLTQAETNGVKLSIFPASSTSNIQVIGCPAVIYTDIVESRITATRAGYIDNLSGGAVALASGVPCSDKTGFSLSSAGVSAIQSGLSTFDPSSDTVARVTLVDTCTTNTDMRGTDGANTTAPDNASITAIKAKTDSLTFTTPLKVDATATVSTSGLATEAKQDTMITHLTDIKGSTFSGSTDSLEAIRDRGDSAWLTGGGMTGSNTITLTIRDGDSNNIVEASVEIYDSAGTTFYEKKFSNSSGQAVFQGDNGTYTVKCHKAGYTFTNTSLVVSGNTSQTITGTAFVLTPSSDPNICRVYTILRDGLNFPATATGTWTAYGTIEIDNTYYSDSSTAGTYTDETGIIYFDIPKNSVATISIPDYITGIFEIPDTDTAELSELNQKP